MTIFKGSGVAIVTPFKENGEVNYGEFKKLIEFQIENKTDAIVATGTTGEASTMTEEEQLEVIKYAVEVVNGRIPVIAGTGSNDTAQTLEMSLKAEKLGVDGLLIVTPYYNKPSQRGLKEHFLTVADKVNTPIILYAVPGRTGISLDSETVKELSKHKNIVGIKDATGDLSWTVEIRNVCGEDFDIYSGNDDVIIPLMSVGGSGVISVLANCMPKETHDMVYEYLEGDRKKAGKMQVNYKEFIDNLFIESNPIPVKAALEIMGYKTGTLRKPLVSISDENREKLKKSMKELKLI